MAFDHEEDPAVSRTDLGRCGSLERAALRFPDDAVGTAAKWSVADAGADARLTGTFAGLLHSVSALASNSVALLASTRRWYASLACAASAM